MRQLLVAISLVCCVCLGFSQNANITQIEFFYDTDPGFGNANQLSFAQDDQVELNFSLDISNLSPGIHSMYVRAKDEFNNWSLYTKKNLFVISGNQATPLIVEVEYFWDTDPGFGNGINLAISSSTTVDQNFTIPINNLSAGIHSLYVRSRDAYNRWSLYTKKNIFIINGSEAIPNIVALEYFFNEDPGLGNATPLSITAATAINENFVIPLAGLTQGNHELYVRAQDAYGRWSLYSQDTVVLGDWNCAYTDTPSTHIAFDAVTDLCGRGILDNDGEAEPDNILNRAELAKLAYLGIGLNDTNSYANVFPSPFNDLQKEDIWYYSFAKNVSYLEFDDHKSPFDRNFFNFKPSDGITKAHTLKVFLEAFNIDETDNTGTTSYTDLDPTHEAYNYIIKAYDLGIIEDNVDNLFHPDDTTIRREAFIMLHRMLTVLALPIPTITDDSFFSPGNYTPETFSTYNALHSGNFNHYTKTSFAISSVGIPLSFEHTYNSYLSEMPPQFTPIKPLGNLWSHTYNSYITEIEGDVQYPDDFRVVVALPNSGFHVYKLDGGNYTSVTNGVYNTLEKPTTSTFTITTKNQIVYTYEKIAGTASNFPYVLVSIQDRNSNTIAVNYEVSQNPNTPNFQRIKEVVGTAGRKLLFSYHANSDVINDIEDPLNRKVFYTYDDSKLIEFKDAKNQSTIYTYGLDYEKDLLMSIQLPKGNIVTNTYENKKLMSSQTNGNQPTNFVYNQNYGQTGIEDFTNTTVTNPNGQVTNIDYNKFGYPNTIEKDTNIDVSIGYDDMHVSKPNDITINNKNATLNYDEQGNLTLMSLPIGVSHSYTYNANSDITQYTDPLGENYSYNYDGNGNLTTITTPRGSTSLTVNNLGLVTQSQNPENITTTYSYDNYGNTISTNAPEGISTSATFDAASRLLSFTNPNGFNSNYSYDNNDNLLQETFNTQTTQYSYDPNDNMTQIKNANNRNTVLTYDFENDFLENVAFEGAEDAYTYYPDGKMETYVNPNGITFTYTYDADGRLSTVNGGSDTVNYTYDSNNNITQISNSNGATNYSYDLLNRITSITDYFGNIVSYEYDLNSNVTKLIYPDNKEVIYTYYSDNLLHTVEDWNNQVTTYTYRNDALLTKVEYPNGTYCDYSYDSAGRMTNISWKKTDTSEFIKYDFTLDPIGNHLTETKWEPYTSTGEANETIGYSYNNANRIQTAGSDSFTFNTNGNTTNKTSNIYTYDVYDRLTNVSGTTTAQYEYDANGNRTKSVVNGEEKRFVLNSLGMSNVLGEANSSNTIQNYYVYGLGLISRIDDSNQTNYYHYDFRGSTIAMTDASETITHKYQYDEFGNLQQSDEADYNAYRYVGKYGVSHESDDLYFMRARFYDPTIGRFLSEDPIWSTNLYPYADNNPVTGIDPKGENVINVVTGIISITNQTISSANSKDNIEGALNTLGLITNLADETSKLSGKFSGVSDNLGIAGTVFSFGTNIYVNHREGLGYQTIPKSLIQTGISGLSWGLWDGEEIFEISEYIGNDMAKDIFKLSHSRLTYEIEYQKKLNKMLDQ
ncbi:RHS repeat-associated core domain-containing protein [Psychroserpens ponticola]|uniref:S-layer homology domain-containing protein n=1 Tax=Psychroserpens ponticola TaxID=2932268 RepID=A0ABY7S064_9FLAO|nr:RHS repeat-associated core domain-containing protein [Psychroserpens ponticola]WCO01861.1 S-layer homology domain-containing protein [Psychroserpens ponticola]